MEPKDRHWWEKRRSYLVTPKATPAEVDEALREDWARGRVAAAGKSWATHMVKFDGTVLPRDQDVVNGIRPHLPMTPEELAERERVMLSLPFTPLGPLDL